MVIWTSRAHADLKDIHDYIAKDVPLNAKSVVWEIVRRADRLTEFPHIGKKVPEIDDPDVRETSAYSWRIIYRLRQDRIFVVTLVHKRRRLDADDISVGGILPE